MAVLIAAAVVGLMILLMPASKYEVRELQVSQSQLQENLYDALNVKLDTWLNVNHVGVQLDDRIRLDIQVAAIDSDDSVDPKMRHVHVFMHATGRIIYDQLHGRFVVRPVNMHIYRTVVTQMDRQIENVPLRRGFSRDIRRATKDALERVTILAPYEGWTRATHVRLRHVTVEDGMLKLRVRVPK